MSFWAFFSVSIVLSTFSASGISAAFLVEIAVPLSVFTLVLLPDAAKMLPVQRMQHDMDARRVAFMIFIMRSIQTILNKSRVIM